MTNTMIDREVIARLRGALYTAQFNLQSRLFLTEDDEADLRSILEALKISAGDPVSPFPQAPGHVFGGIRLVKLERGSFFHFSPSEGVWVNLEVIDFLPDGQVHLRPVFEKDVESYSLAFPSVEFRKGDLEAAPFKRIEKGNLFMEKKFSLKIGDLLAHEAWSVWLSMFPGKRN